MSGIDHDEREHYLNGGSSLGRRIQCPGSLKMEEPIPEPETSEYAEDGTRVHECIETLIPVAIRNTISRMQGIDVDLYESAPKLLSYDSEHIEAAKLAVDDILGCMGDMVADVGWVAEHKFIRSKELQLGGTADMAWAYSTSEGRYAHIWDYKNGVNPVDLETTPQLLSYAVALQHETREKGREEFDTVTTYIFQPNSTDETKIKQEKVYTKEEIAEADKMFVEVAEIVLGMHGEAPMFLRSGEYCRYCKAKAICVEYHKSQTTKAAEVFDSWDEEEREELSETQENGIIPFNPKPGNPEEVVKTLTDEQLVQFIKHKDYLKAALAAVDSYVKLRAKSGTPVEGLKCVESKGRRGWKTDLSTPQLGKKLKELGIKAPYEKKIITLGKAEEELKALGMTAKAAKEAIKDIAPEGKPSIKIVLDDESDNRPAIEGMSAKKIDSILDAAEAE